MATEDGASADVVSAVVEAPRDEKVKQTLPRVNSIPVVTRADGAGALQPCSCAETDAVMPVTNGQLPEHPVQSI
jgi:hypothetical protein